MNKYNTPLEAKVGERNAVNQAVIDMWPVAINALRPFVGEKILNQGFIKSGKLIKALPQFPNTPALSVYISASQYGLRLDVKTCGVYKDRHGEHHCACYAESSWHLADVDGYNLGKINELPPTGLRTDYKVEEIQKAREELKTAEKAASAARSQLSHFGEHDNF